MSELPKGWASATIGEVVADRVKQGPPSAAPVAYIDISAIDRERKVVGELDNVTAQTAPTRARQWVEAGDVLVSMTRPNLNAVAMVPDKLAGAVASTGFDVLRPTGVLPEWLFARVQSQDFVQELCAGIQGVVYPAVRPQDIRKQVLPVPPQKEQRRIVEAIESYLSRLDAAVASLTQAQKKLKAYRASVLKAAVEGRLVPTEAELAKAEGRTYEPADKLLERILVERRRAWEERQLADMKAKGKAPKDDKWKAKCQSPSAVTDFPPNSLPEGWGWATLEALILEGPQNGLYVPKERYGSGTPILRVDDYQVDRSTSSGQLQRVVLASDDSVRFGLRLGDIVLNRVNSPTHLGKTMVVEGRNLPAVFESNMMRFRLSTGALPKYINAYLCSPEGKRRLTANAKWAVNQASINQEDVGSTVVPLPPLAEQERIAEELGTHLGLVERCAEDIRNQLLRCARLRQAILKAAFEGQLVDQDPNDEPASELLARLRTTPEPEAPKPKRGRTSKKKTA